MLVGNITTDLFAEMGSANANGAGRAADRRRGADGGRVGRRWARTAGLRSQGRHDDDDPATIIAAGGAEANVPAIRRQLGQLSFA